MLPLTNLLIAFVMTGASIFALKPVAVRIGLVDIPGGRKTHVEATPLVGGLGIFLGILAMVVVTPGMLGAYAPFLSLSALILFIGTVDDAKELTPHVRMTGHALVALAMAVVAEVQLHSLGELIPALPLQLGVFAIPLTIFATVGVINAINMADGIDGLSGGLVVVALGFIALTGFIGGDANLANFCIVVICSILAFLTLNFRRPWNLKALVYLGDAGSTMLGFMLAWLLIDATQRSEPIFAPVYALWFLAVPLFDTVNLLIKRPLRGTSPFTPGTDHLHHNLLQRGFSVAQVVVILLAVALALGGVGLLSIRMGASEALMFQLFIALFVIYFIFSDRIAPRAQR